MFVLRGFRFPVGPDGPVYLWWTRLAGADGLSRVERPGAVALLGVVRWTGVGLPAAVAGAECALGVAVGLASAAVARAGGRSRVASTLAGALAGTFATHLVAGYVSNLVFAVLFLAAIAALASTGRRAIVAGVALFGAAALAHPLFFLVGVAVLAIAGALAFRTDRARTWAALLVSLGGGAILGLGWLTMLAGPPVLATDTSQDAFLRRAGLTDSLAHAYRDRLIHRWMRYVEWVSIPLAAFGAGRPGGWIRRALWAWVAVTAAGVALGAATAWFPPDRYITFGYAIPILAAFGLVALVDRWRARRRLAIGVAAALAVAMVAGAGIAWLREKPYIGERAVDDVALASRYGSTSQSGTPWIFPVDSPSTRVSFLATRLQNVIRAAVPPDRIQDVRVVVPPPPFGLSPDERREWATLARLYASDADEPRASLAVVVDIAAFDARTTDRAPVCAPTTCRALTEPRVRLAEGVSISRNAAAATPAPRDATLDSSTVRIAVGAPLMLAVLSLAGFGWALLTLREPVQAAALAPAFGTGAVILVAVVADRLGVRSSGAGPGLLVLGVATAAGYGALLLERRRGAHPAP